jgi:hypothetical protein
MRFLMRLLSVFIFFGWVGYSDAYEIDVDWQLDGSMLRFQIVDVNSQLPDSATVDCGLFATCFVSVRIGFSMVYKFPNIPSMRGKQSINKLAKVWASSSPRGSINNWTKLVEKNGGQAPCLVFDMNGYSFAATCDGNVTPPPVPKPPEPQISCYLSGNIYLQHGSLADSEVAANKANTTARVYCTGAAKVKVRALSSIGSDSYMVNLRSDGSLQSLLTVNGVVGNGNGVLLDVPGLSGKDVVFSSMLITSGTPAPGDFSGSAVAVVDIL